MMTAQITPFPGHGPATRVLFSHTATDEQRRVAAEMLDTYPHDLLWMAPGTPQMYRCTAVKSRAVEWLSAASTAAVIFAAGWVGGLLTMIFILRGAI